MDVTSLGFRTDLMMLAMQGAAIVDQGDHLVVRTATQPTFHWGNFLLFADPPASADTARWQQLFRDEFPNATHMTFGLDTTDGTTGDLRGFAEAGIAAERSVVLTARVVHPPPRPDSESQSRMLATDDDWSQAVELRMTVDAVEDVAGHLLFVERRSAAMRALQDGGRGGAFGAFIDDRLVCGLGVYTDGNGVASYQSVETRHGFRNRGLAGMLVAAAGRYALDELGARTLVIVADPEYVASRIYRSVGFDGTETQIQLSRS